MVDLEKMPRGLIDIRTSELSKAAIASAIAEFSLSATFVMISVLVITILAKVMNSKGFRFNKLIVTALGTIYAILLVIAGRGAGLFAVKGFFSSRARTLAPVPLLPVLALAHSEFVWT